MATPETYHRLEEENEMKHLSEECAQPTRQLPQYAPYPAIPAPAAQLQQASNNNVVVATQPTATPPVTVVAPQLKAQPTVMIVTIVLTAVCLVQGCLPALVCLTPALIAAIVGFALSDAASEEQRYTAKAFHGIAICCNIATVVYYILAGLSLIITLASVFGSVRHYSSSGCCGYSTYGTYRCYC